MRIAKGSAAIIALCAVLSACQDQQLTSPTMAAVAAKTGGGNTPPCPGVPAGTTGLTMIPNGQVTIGVGSTLDFNVVNQANVPLPDCALSWSTSSSRIATVNSAGLVTGKSLGGAVTITAQTTGKPVLKATGSVLVGATVASVTVSPNPATIVIGGTLQLTAAPRDAKHNVLTGRLITWTSSDTTKARVSATGLVSWVAPGSVTVTATVEGKAGTTAISLVAAADGSVARYPFNGSAQDSLTSTQGGAPTSIAWRYDRYGAMARAAEFQTASSQITLPGTVINNLAAGTISLWIRWDSVAAAGMILSRPMASSQGTYALSLNGCTDANGALTGGASPGQLCWHPRNASTTPVLLTSAGSLVPGFWNHVAITWSASAITLFLNGALDRTIACANCGVLDFGTVAGMIGGGSASFRGALDDLRIYNQALSNTDIATIASANRPMVLTGIDPATDLKSLYRVNPVAPNPQRILSASGFDIAPAISPDGNSLIFSSNRHCYPACPIYQLEVHQANIDGSNIRQLTSGMWSVYSKTWAPDGINFAFEASGGTPFPDNLRVYTSNVTGSAPAQITTDIRSRWPDWSSDNQRVVYTVEGVGLYSIKTDGADKRFLRAGAGFQPKWSPDARRIVFCENDDVWIMNANGTNAIMLVGGPGSDCLPTWSPDGARVAFISTRTGASQVWSVFPDGTGLVQVTSGALRLGDGDPIAWR